MLQVPLRDNYFTSTTLLDLDLSRWMLANPLAAGGQRSALFSINVHVAVEDASGVEWHIGPDLSIPIQVLRK
jgi:hypothetical protein